MLVLDQLNRKIEIPFSPKRIISLVPSQTELLASLGLDREVVGITKFCVHPQKWFRSKTRIGGTKKLNIDQIRRLQPDLILGNKEENEISQMQQLMKEFPVWMSDINTLSDALNMIQTIGEITDKKGEALAVTREISSRFELLQQTLNGKAGTQNAKPFCTYFIWHNPWMVAGNNTFIHEMIQYCGLKNRFAHLTRYPEISPEQLQNTLYNCRDQVLLLSSEPFPFKEKHAEEIREIFPEAKIIFVDGEMFSWYGSRLLKAPAYFAKLRDQIAGMMGGF